MGPDDERIIYISEPTYRFVCRLFYCFLLKILHEKIFIVSKFNTIHTNVIQLSVPHRHDLINKSCVNREVKIFNNNLRNRLKHFNNVEMIEVTSERELYTKHGQHINSRGKETMANKIALSIENV